MNLSAHQLDRQSLLYASETELRGNGKRPFSGRPINYSTEYAVPTVMVPLEFSKVQWQETQPNACQHQLPQSKGVLPAWEQETFQTQSFYLF